MKKLIIANWKLNPTTAKEAVKLAGLVSVRAKNTSVLCPPNIYLSQIQYPRLGAQDCFWQEKGPFTGQTSPVQLKDLKIKYCIIGHSEKRVLGESDEMVNAKIKACLACKIIPVVCVGFGTSVENDDMEVVDILRKQLSEALKGVETEKIVVAYEPVWAIGTGHVASPEHAEKIAIFIKNRYHVAKVLYGGSVNVRNAAGFLQLSNVGGLLVGGASLKPSEFNQIINM